MSYAFGVTCFLLIGCGLFPLLSVRAADVSTTRLRIGVQKPGAREELPMTYDQRFIKTEEALIESRFLSGRLVEILGVKGTVGDNYGDEVQRGMAESIAKARTHAESVEGTSLIDLYYFEHGGGATARRIADIYHDYWNRRSETNLVRQVRVAVVDSDGSMAMDARITTKAFCVSLTQNLRRALFVLAGVICAALLARNPVQLYLLAIGAVLYVVALGLAWLPTAFGTQTYAATCPVRIWPSDVQQVGQTGHQAANGHEWTLGQESELAGSEEVSDRTLDVLDGNPSFMKAERNQWQAMSRSEKRRWLKDRLRVIPAEKSFLIGITAWAANAEDAAEICNATAAAYCDFSRQPSERTEVNHFLPEVEILDSAVPVRRPRESLNPIAQGLLNGLGLVGWFLGGAGIGCIGYVVEKIRRIKAQEGACPL